MTFVTKHEWQTAIILADIFCLEKEEKLCQLNNTCHGELCHTNNKVSLSTFRLGFSKFNFVTHTHMWKVKVFFILGQH